jgi:hypothetical protein
MIPWSPPSQKIWQKIMILEELKTTTDVPGRGRACPGRLTSIILALPFNTRRRRHMPRDDAGK